MFTNFVLETIGVKGIIKLVNGKIEIANLEKCFVIAMTFKKPKLFKRIVKGKISKKPLSKVKSYHWSKLALIFIPEGERKTMAEMTKKEFMNFRKRVDKNSHWEQFGKFFSKL